MFRIISNKKPWHLSMYVNRQVWTAIVIEKIHSSIRLMAVHFKFKGLVSGNEPFKVARWVGAWCAGKF